MGRDLARSDRLAALGRMAAGLAHEIGNPLAAMRLRSENALAAEPERARAALRAILPQIGRLEELLAALRLLTRMVEIRPQPVPLRPFLQARLEEVAPTAAARGRPGARPAPAAEARWSFDEKSLARAVENLLLNALQHTPPAAGSPSGRKCPPSAAACWSATPAPASRPPMPSGSSSRS